MGVLWDAMVMVSGGSKNTHKIRVEIGGRAAAYLFAYFMRTDLKKKLSPQIRQIRIKRQAEIRTKL